MLASHPWSQIARTVGIILLLGGCALVSVALAQTTSGEWSSGEEVTAEATENGLKFQTPFMVGTSHLLVEGIMDCSTGEEVDPALLQAEFVFDQDATSPYDPSELTKVIVRADGFAPAEIAAFQTVGISIPGISVAFIVATIEELCLPQTFTIYPVSPQDCSSVSLSEGPLALVWNPDPIASEYAGALEHTLTIVEVREGQAGEQAMASSSPILRIEGIEATEYVHPACAVDLQEDQTYAWRVEAFAEGYPVGASAVYSFSIATALPDTAMAVELLWPSNGEEVDACATLGWWPIPLTGVVYDLRIWRMPYDLEGSSAEDVLFTEDDVVVLEPVLVAQGLVDTWFTLGDESDHSLEAGFLYAWQVIPNLGSVELGPSEIRGFGIQQLAAKGAPPPRQMLGHVYAGGTEGGTIVVTIWDGKGFRTQTMSYKASKKGLPPLTFCMWVELRETKIQSPPSTVGTDRPLPPQTKPPTPPKYVSSWEIVRVVSLKELKGQIDRLKAMLKSVRECMENNDFDGALSKDGKKKGLENLASIGARIRELESWLEAMKRNSP